MCFFFKLRKFDFYGGNNCDIVDLIIFQISKIPCQKKKKKRNNEAMKLKQR